MGKEMYINSHIQVVKGNYIFSDEIEKVRSGDCESNVHVREGKNPWYSQSILAKLCRKNY